ncbi:MAG: beta-ketoacyl synthase chain length factor [Spirochaetales bacterium]|nr:beta-ketoacyl synthase chain length factor [Spirochaetales bacterium]
MINKSVYISRWSVWSPGVCTKEDWQAWSCGKKSLSSSFEKPVLDYVPSLFKRRLSQLTRMTIQVGHEVLSGHPPMKLAFASVYGEIGQQLKITKKLVEENEVSPANFSLSVFNTPVAALSIVEKNTEGYVACYPGPEAFKTGFLESAAAILAGSDRDRLFITADENIPEEYKALHEGKSMPYAIALVLSSSECEGSIKIDIEDFIKWIPEDDGTPAALHFLKEKILPGSV